MSNTPAIRFSGVTKEFGSVTALEGLDLTVQEGEIYGFLGPNGAGKSTAINILLDFLPPTSGDVTVLGHDAQAESATIRERIGVLPDAFRPYERLTGRQHLEFAIESKNADDDAEELLERVGILDAADRKAGGYSKGMTQRLVLAMALVGSPELIILDEPSTGLDPNGAMEMREIILEENRRGATVFFSSHILEQVEAICDRVGILRDGRLVAENSIDDLQQQVDAESVLTVTVSSLTDESVAAAQSVDGVTNVKTGDNKLMVQLNAESKLPVLEAIDATGVEVRDFETDEESLEDLFSTYTSGEVAAE
ncbi:ABC transporter ATP-binding protein (plasmid) [Haloferax mediterranei ATCC 33500]|uniref:ABC transporter ATP-binding protein n=1 Tax=Haloferax mediterranei (strain ATCC 33500 / DSM 1411 / JCM 8866 / NBRC 14739 / NCIMB 2177 / R-4) TaxID=523841 RepID=I3R9K8_HALMT|nr:ABC transporter ATP-binding protein [Haloferax mediterranei]AFK20918.1 ABC transporter ATP-binding protein [Haloferax mediterranei ATCC 33500]AHZ24213.1 copper ABC transporter ATP-binding protein [Haloferax mediterranei ATCC 33500]EMA05292.1 ABC transporter ATP-binding protein [Haloferax mediterranei ATCC 33500]MDX5989906.1 ABC transporter ATP-binding protein [Haloferax mediterranei ATCC 33500]QCQ77347.1 ABC transporter ATP-binding protein [Haloferax mediterranei ATCC 33500]